MKRITYIILILTLVVASCEKIIDISVPNQSRRIVMNSVLNPDSIVSVRLSQSKSILEDNTIYFLDAAEVKLFEEDQLLGFMEYNGLGQYFLPGFKPQNNLSYRIEVVDKVLESIQSDVRIPEIVPLIDIDTSRSMEEWGQATFNLDVKINDPPGVDNYYAMSIAVTSRIFDWETEGVLDSTETYMAYLRSVNEGDSDIGEEFLNQNLTYNIDDKLFFSDELFDGNTNELELSVKYYVYTYMADSVMIDIRVDHIDPSYYFYSVSKEKYYQSDGNPFAEPVQVYNNIDNGFGLLGAYSRTSKKYSMFVGGWK